MGFDSQGNLFLAIGDGGNGNDPCGNGQKPSVLFGKLIRIKPNTTQTCLASGNYTIPATNPFLFNSTYMPEIYAIGLRNPWTGSIEPGDLVYIGNVGQNDWEETSYIPAGSNRGWNIAEGDAVFLLNPNAAAQYPALYATQGTSIPPYYVRPMFDYRHPATTGANHARTLNGTTGQCIVYGGTYKGSRLTAIQGWHVFADETTPPFPIWAVQAIGNGANGFQSYFKVMDAGIVISRVRIDPVTNEMYFLQYSGTARVWQFNTTTNIQLPTSASSRSPTSAATGPSSSSSGGVSSATRTATGPSSPVPTIPSPTVPTSTRTSSTVISMAGKTHVTKGILAALIAVALC